VSSSATGFPSSSPSVLVPGSGILPFPTTTSSSSSSSGASTTPLSSVVHGVRRRSQNLCPYMV
jgi:hypothetical protein